jgi:hypothetical protein
MVNMVVPVAERLKEAMLRDDDHRVGDLLMQLNALRHAREVGDWDGAQATAQQLVGLVVNAPREREAERVE